MPTAKMIEADIAAVVLEHDATDAYDYFRRELADLKKDIFYKDRRFNNEKKHWVITNTNKYEHLHYIKAAIENAAIQSMQFDRDQRTQRARRGEATLKEIVAQLEWCHYTSIGGPLENNIYFINLKKLAEET